MEAENKTVGCDSYHVIARGAANGPAILLPRLRISGSRWSPWLICRAKVNKVVRQSEFFGFDCIRVRDVRGNLIHRLRIELRPALSLRGQRVIGCVDDHEAHHARVIEGSCSLFCNRVVHRRG